MTKVTAIGSLRPINNSYEKGIMSTQIRVKDILDIYEIDKTINRDLGAHRLPALTKYFDSIETEIGIFLPSIVLSFHGDLSNYDPHSNKLIISRDEKLAVIDGQHRIKGIENFVNKSGIDAFKKEQILNSFLTVQIYFGLSIDDERKLFTDINSNAKMVSRSLTTKYDTRDILNVLVKELYHSSDALQTVKVEFNKSRIMRPGNTSFITSVRLKNFISYLLFGKKAASQKNEKQVKEQYDEIFSFFNKLFTILFSTLPSNPGNVLDYVLGHEPVQNAIALYLHESLILENEDQIKWLESWEDEVEQLKFIDWTPKNKEWYPFMMTSGRNIKYQSFIETTMLDLNGVIKRKLL